MAKAKSYIGIKNEAESKTLELHFTDYIYDGFNWETWEYENLVQDTINKIKDANPDKIKVVINSLGGDVMIGLALYNYLKAHKAEKEVQIIGFAASIASVMAMCADKGKLKMAKNAFMIIHAAWSYASGTAADMREQAETLDKITNELADIYAQRSGKDAKHFTKLWKNGDYWMTGSEAKEEGLVDELFNAEPVKATLDFSAHNFKHIPEGLIAAAVDNDKAPSDQKSFFSNLNSHFMKFIDKLSGIVKAAKEDKTYEDVPGRDKVLDMVQNVFKPFAEEMDAAAEASAAAQSQETEEQKPAEQKPKAEKKPVAEKEKPAEKAKAQSKGGDDEDDEEDDDEAKAELERLRAENKKLKAAVAGKETKPAADPADKKNAEIMSRVKVRMSRDDDDDE